MKRIDLSPAWLLPAVFMAFSVSCNNSTAQTEAAVPAPVNKPMTNESFAVLELFTSQGCSSCPPADRLLARTINANAGKNIFALSFHVDYWNRLGWADPFSRREFSNRQGEYASRLRTSGPYTPQLVVNGTREFVGSDQQALKRALDAALATTATVKFSKLEKKEKEGNEIKVKFKAEGDLKDCLFNFALVSLTETTDIKRGENGGLKLTNQNVVRDFVTVPATAEGEITLTAPTSQDGSNTRVIAYAQAGSVGKIIGAAAAD